MEDVVYEADPNKTGSVTMSTFFIIAARKFRDAGEIEKTTESAFNKIYIAPPTDTSVEKKIPLNTVFRNAVLARGGEPLTEALIDDFIRQIPPTLIDRDNQIKITDLISVVMADIPPIDENKPRNEENEEPIPETPPDEDTPAQPPQPKKSFFSFFSRAKKQTEEKENNDEVKT